MVKVHLCTPCLNATSACVDAFPLYVYICADWAIKVKSYFLFPPEKMKMCFQMSDLFPHSFFFFFFSILLKKSLHVRLHSCNDDLGVSAFTPASSHTPHLLPIFVKREPKKKIMYRERNIVQTAFWSFSPSWQCKQFYRTWFFLLLFFSSD